MTGLRAAKRRGLVETVELMPLALWRLGYRLPDALITKILRLMGEGRSVCRASRWLAARPLIKDADQRRACPTDPKPGAADRPLPRTPAFLVRDAKNSYLAGHDLEAGLVRIIACIEDTDVI